MEDELIKIATSQGIWATLSIFLIFYILKVQRKRDEKQEEREGNYQDIISSLTERITIIQDIDKNVKNIAINLKEIKNEDGYIGK